MNQFPKTNSSYARQLLSRLFVADSDYDAFIIDYFPRVKTYFTNGMDRTTKINILLERTNALIIIQTLRQLFPNESIQDIPLGDISPSRADPSQWFGDLDRETIRELMKTLQFQFFFEKESGKFYFSSSKAAAGLVGHVSQSPPQRANSHEQSSEIKLSLEARGSFSLYEKLIQLETYEVNNRFSIKKLFKAGSESVVYLAADRNSKTPIICKIPFIDYAHPARISSAEIEYAREHLIEESQVLTAQSISYFPSPVALEIAPCPLHPRSRPPSIRDREIYLFEEFVCGPTVEEETWAWHKQPNNQRNAIGSLIMQVAADVIDFQDKLYSNGKGYYYTDLCPRNMVIDEKVRRVRHVDAGSVIPADHSQLRKLRRSTVAYTAPYLAPSDRNAVERHGGVAYSAKVCLAMLGRSLFSIATNGAPRINEELNRNHPLFQNLPQPARDFIETLAYGELADFGKAWKYLTTTVETLAKEGS